MVKNTAFVFIKPHAVTDKVKDLVKETFEKKDFAIKKEGLITGEEIDKKKLVDQHYYSIASKATLQTPDKLNVPKEKFKEKFGLDWDEALKTGNVLNGKDAMEKFEIDAVALDKMWGECKKSGNLIKFGGGFYCGKLMHKDTAHYVFNGFFMEMRSKYVAADASVYYYVVEWESTAYSWEDFRGKVLGPTDPKTAPEDSLRGLILSKWKDLDLKSEPNVGDNGMHASASPFEALCERMNWLGYRLTRDPWGKLLAKAGVKVKDVREWAKDPQVTFGPIPMTRSLFDSLEDTDSDYCLALCQMIGGYTGKSSSEKLQEENERLKAEIQKYKYLDDALVTLHTIVAAREEETPTKGKGKGKSGKSKGKGKGRKSED